MARKRFSEEDILKLVNKTRRKLSKIAAAKNVSIAIKKLKRHVKPGGRLMREWHGKSDEVYICTDGIIMDGKHYKSLSVVAQKITGAKWNGPRFFGLRSTRTERAS